MVFPNRNAYSVVVAVAMFPVSPSGADRRAAPIRQQASPSGESAFLVGGLIRSPRALRAHPNSVIRTGIRRSGLSLLALKERPSVAKAARTYLDSTRAPSDTF